MKRLFVLAIVFGLVGSLNAKDANDFKPYYEIKLSLDMPSVKDVAIINALVDFDPLAVFKKDVLRQESRKKVDKEVAEFDQKHGIPEYVTASTEWDLSVFDEVKASDVSILQQKKFGGTHGRSGSGDIKDKKMWLVTKATVYGKKPLVWAIPLDIKEGFKADVVLNKKNAINLVDLYKQIVAEAAKK